MKPSDLTVTDQFCGAGGSSIGAEQAGLRLLLGMNHWRRAIETHAQNFPNADHVCADISSTDPRRYPSTHVLITSPECRNHSQAKTRKERATLWDPHGADEAERSRATMMDVPRFTEYHGYEFVVVENVVEVARWVGFGPWLMYMRNLGYEHEMVCLNSLVAHPTPQSRDRLYVVFWKRGNPKPDLSIQPRSWCPTCGDVDGVQTFRRADRRIGKYRQQYDYRCPVCRGIVHPYAYPAAAAIDWALPTSRIGDRSRPLAPATRRRVQIGLERFGTEAYLAVLRTHQDARSLNTPMPTLVAGNVGHALVQPAIVQVNGHTWVRPDSDYVRAWLIDNPLPAQTATLSHALTIPPWLLAVTRSHAEADNSHVRSVDEPFPVQTAQQEWALALPFIAELRGGASDARSVAEPLAAVCASGNHHALVQPAFVVKNYGDAADAVSMVKPITDPLGTVTAIDHHSLLTLPFLTSYYGRSDASAITDPIPTVTTRDRHALVDPQLAIDDCGFRMLEPHEIKAAMAFPATYAITGNKREQVRQAGNAVTPPVMRLLLARCIATL